MADSTIGSLPLANVIYDSDYFALEQDGIAKRLTGLNLTNYINRNIMNVNVVQLAASQTAYSEFNKANHTITFYIPKGDSISNIYRIDSGHVTFFWESGRQQTLDLIKGDTGKSAYQYAVEQGYTGTETDFAQLMLLLYESAANEQARITNEEQRNDTFTYIQEDYQRIQESYAEISAYQDSYVIDTTLFLFKGGIQGTTLFL